MVTPPLYKNTEFGLLPTDWDIMPIGGFTTKVGSGVTPTGGNRVYCNEGRPFVRSQNIGWGQLLLEEIVFIDELTHASFASTEVRLHDVLLNITGASIGRSALADIRIVAGNVNQHVCIIRTEQQKVLPHFLCSFLLSNLGQRQIDSFQAGGNRQGLNFAQVRSIRIPVPSTIKEQTAIAEALSDAGALIASLQKLIAKKKAIKQGAMQELLTGKRRLPGFSGGWKEKTFSELFYISGGVSASRDKLSTKGFCYLHYGDIHASSKQYSDTSTDAEKIPRLDISLNEINKSSLLKNGDIVFVDASEDDEGTCKHIAIRNAENVPYISGLHTIICSSKHNELANLFKEYCFCTESIKRQIIYYAAGTKVKGVNKNNIAKIVLSFPSDLKEQIAIAQILSDMDTEIEQLEKKLSKYQQIKQGMMQELLTGRIRLIDVESKQEQPAPSKKHSQQFDDAVMIAGIVDAFYSEKYPLGRKKVQKLLYLMRRKEEADVSAFLKKAAGPYADTVRYKGGESIAKRSSYIVADTSGKGTRFSRGDKIEQALGYIQTWEKQDSIDWLVSNFQRTRIDDLELFATVDMAICDLREIHKPVSVHTIKELIGSTEEWREKLTKTYFSDLDIQRAINKCRELFEEQ